MNCKKVISLLVLTILLLTLTPIVPVVAWPSEMMAENTFAASVILISRVVLANTQIVVLAILIVFYITVELKRFGAFGFPGPPRFVVRFYTAISTMFKSFNTEHNMDDESKLTTERTVAIVPFQARISLAA